MDNLTGKLGLGGIVVVGLLSVFTMLGSFYTIDQRELGVILRNGAVTGIATPGLNFKLPWIDKVVDVSLENRLWRPKEKLEGYSHDQQAAHYVISVNWQIDPTKVQTVYTSFGGEAGVEARVVTPAVLKHSKIVIGTFTAQTSIRERGKVNTRILEALHDAVEGTPVQITEVNVEDIKFSAEYEKSINDRMIAEVRVETERQNLNKEKVLAEIVVTKAQAAADSKLADAKAVAQAISLQGNAEAEAITVKGKALRDNPAVIELAKADKWNGVLPSTMVPGAATPILNVQSPR